MTKGMYKALLRDALSYKKNKQITPIEYFELVKGIKKKRNLEHQQARRKH